MITHNFFSVVILEPNSILSTPYDYLPRSYTIKRFSSVSECKSEIKNNPTQLFFLSASIGPTDTVALLDLVREKNELPGIIVVVDLSNPLSFVVGTTWGGKLAVIDSHTSAQEFFSTISRVI